jgi:hypothetical protein
MINKITSVLLILSLFCNTVIGQELSDAEDETNFDLSSTKWEAIPAPKVVGDLELTVWITYQGVEAPRSGYFVLKKDWVEINRMLNSFDEEINRVKNKERKECDKSLKEKDESCERINKSLRLEIDKLKSKNNIQLVEIKSLEDKNFWTLTISGSVLVLVTIFAVSSGSN